MKIDLTKLTIKFPEEPTEIKEDEEKRKCWHNYLVPCFSDKQVGCIRVSLAIKYPEKYRGDFWHNLDVSPIKIRPVVIWQNTDENFYGNGISGKIITLANEIAKNRFNQPLASDTLFCASPSCYWDIYDFAERPAMRVWEKLEEQGLAYRKDYQNKPRWIMY